MLQLTAFRIRRHIKRDILERRASAPDPLADEALDSLQLEQLVSYLEDKFDLVFTDGELVAENFASIHALARLVEAKRKSRGGQSARVQVDQDPA